MDTEIERLDRCFPFGKGTAGDWAVKYVWRPKMTEDRGVAWLRKVYVRTIERGDTTTKQYAWYEEKTQ
jgi:hypothetical protein